MTEQWINVNNNLPINGLRVMIYTKKCRYGYGHMQNNYDKSRRYWTGYYDNGDSFIGDSDEVGITHYQLLSPPELLES